MEDPTELERLKAALWSIEHPQPVSEERIKALEADPTGIWSNLHRTQSGQQ